TIDHVNGTFTYFYDPTTRRLTMVIKQNEFDTRTSYTYYPAGVPNAGLVSASIVGANFTLSLATYFDYTPKGQLYRKWGVNTYPVQLGYDPVTGLLTSMTTYRTAPGTVNWNSSTW